MAKKHLSQDVRIGKTGSLLQRYAGKTKSVGGFLPIWKPLEAGEEVLAEYVKTETVPGMGEGKKKREDFQSFVLRVKEDSNIHLIKSKTIAVPALAGVEFTVSGDVMANALKDAEAGQDYILIFSGMGEAKGGNNAPKLFEVHQLQAA